MDYNKIYNNLVSKTYTDDYTEVHHIIPKCLGGDNSKDNLVRLSPEAHYLAHQLLVKIYPDNHKLVYAASMMTTDTHGKRVNNKLFGWLRRKISKVQSEAKSGEKHPMFGKKRTEEFKQKMSSVHKDKIVSDETKQKMSEAKKGKKLSIEHKQKLFIANKGKIMSDETKKKLSENHKNKPKLECQYCNKLADAGNFKQWHGDKCKLKPIL